MAVTRNFKLFNWQDFLKSPGGDSESLRASINLGKTVIIAPMVEGAEAELQLLELPPSLCPSPRQCDFAAPLSRGRGPFHLLKQGRPCDSPWQGRGVSVPILSPGVKRSCTLPVHYFWVACLYHENRLGLACGGTLWSWVILVISAEVPGMTTKPIHR